MVNLIINDIKANQQ